MPVAAAVPIAAATVGSTALNVAGGLFSNKTNKKIARETNALNYKMFQEANDYNTRMWNAANQYNLPVNQKQRLIDAGVNPAALVDSPQLGAVSNNSPSSVSPPQMQGWNYQNVFANLGNDMVALTQAQKNIEEAKGQKIDNSNKDALFVATLDNLVANKLLSEAEADKYRQDVDFTESNWNSLSQQISQNAYNVQQQARLTAISADLEKYFGGWMKVGQIAELGQRVNLLIEQQQTEKATQLLNRKLGNKADSDAIANRIVANATAANQYSQAEKTNLENSVYRAFGRGKAASDLLNSIYDGEIKSADALDAAIRKAVDESAIGKGSKSIGHVIRNILPILKQIKF